MKRAVRLLRFLFAKQTSSMQVGRPPLIGCLLLGDSCSRLQATIRAQQRLYRLRKSVTRTLYLLLMCSCCSQIPAYLLESVAANGERPNQSAIQSWKARRARACRWTKRLDFERGAFRRIQFLARSERIRKQCQRLLLKVSSSVSPCSSLHAHHCVPMSTRFAPLHPVSVKHASSFNLLGTSSHLPLLCAITFASVLTTRLQPSTSADATQPLLCPSVVSLPVLPISNLPSSSDAQRRDHSRART